jgi:predicted MPP superfamily phosphohydrolase
VKLISPQFTRRRFLHLFSAAAAAGIVTCAVDATWFEPRRPVVARLELAVPRLPRQLDGLTIAQLSDFHFDSDSSEDLIRSAVAITNGLAPDLIALTGDYVTVSRFSSRFHATENSKPCAALLGELRAPLGVFGVLGNHDESADPRFVTRSLEAHGVTVLRNFNLRIETRGERLWIAGVDDVLTGNAKLGQALQGIPADGATVLLAHEPDFADSVAGQAVDLQLSGHSHGGQVRFSLLGAVYLPPMARKYPYGLNQIGRLKLYTNRGLGTIVLPVRFGCPPEITLLTLRSELA